MRFKVAKGQKALKLHAQISGLAGKYRYDVRLNGKRVATGKFEAKVGSASTLRLKAGQPPRSSRGAHEAAPPCGAASPASR